MAPQKTVAIKQQPHQQQQQLKQQQQNTTTATTIARKDSGDRSDVKSRKRKGKQQASNIERNNSQEQPTNDKANGSGNNFNENVVSNSNKNTEKVQQLTKQTNPNTLATSERTENKQQQQQNHVPSSPIIAREQEDVNLKKISEPIVSGTVIAKQLSRDEPDDIDAGIELDGSSNSGSSVKDISEEQSKSMSVSPVMAQNNLVNEDHLKTKVAPIEQLSDSLCNEEMITPCKKLGVTTKQQLAANQQVIDADEQQLQQKLQSKQRRSSTQSNGANNLNTSSNNNISANTSHHNNASPQSPAICKVCEQHVYQMERMLAEKSVYHKRCFRCYQCKIQLRVDNYSSHEGQVYCKAHHRQIFQPQVKLDSADDVDIVAKSTTRTDDDYLAHRGRLSELSFSFLQLKPEGIRKRQMIICENEPAELPKDVVRCDTKVDDGFEQLNVNLNNILEKFERGGEESQPSSAGIVIDKPSFNLKKTLMAFEKQTVTSTEDESISNRQSERPVVKKLTNLNGIFNKQSSTESESSTPPVKPLAIRRSESLMMRLKKYESRIAGEQVDEDCESTSDEDENNNNKNDGEKSLKKNDNQLPKKLSSINLSTLRNQWESGDINKRRLDGDNNDVDGSGGHHGGVSEKDSSPMLEKKEELFRIRQQLARKKSGEAGSSVKNIYENAVREAQLQQTQQASRRNSNDLLALNGFSTSEIQQQLLQNGSNQNTKTPTTPNKDHFQLNMSNKANKLKAKFEQGLITNNSQDDSDQEDGDQEPTMSKLDQIRHEKMEDLSIFTEGEIKAREARNMFQQIDRRLSAANGQQQQQQQAPPNPRSLSTISASMRSQLLNQMNQSTNNAMPKQTTPESQNQYDNNHQPVQGRPRQQVTTEKQPIRLTNNVRI